MGIRPQGADLTGDGVEDLYTGCFEGGVYVIPGKQTGGYGKPFALLDKAGQVLRIGQYWDNDEKKWTRVSTSKYKGQLGISAAAVDWDADGDLDLVLGTNGGGVFVRLNEGSAGSPAFATESIPVMTGPKPMKVAGGGALPVTADWDGDGLWDLVSGSAEGGAVWFENIGSKGKPAFAEAKVLAAARKGPRPPGEPQEPGRRTLVYVADFDSDGDLDLLIGDYATASGGGRHGWVWLVKRTGGEAKQVEADKGR